MNTHDAECSGQRGRADNRKGHPAGVSVAAVRGWGWNSPGEAEQEARRIFQRHLRCWAMDVLALRRLGLDRPVGRGGTSTLVVPHYS